MKKKICVVTGSRAEYGLLKPLMDEIKKEPALKLQLVVTGMHLSEDFGLTYKLIEEDGFNIDEKVNIHLDSDSAEMVAKSTGLAVSSMAEAYKKLDPDVVILLGDRFEIFGAAAAALISRIPIAHIHGGELTEGAIDDAFRHSITKMSHLHFTSTEEYRKRVIQLGEQPEHVYNVGALGLDNIRKMKLLSREETEKKLGFSFGKRNLIVTFHPVTLEEDTAEEQFKNLLDAIDSIEEAKIIFTEANADMGGRAINSMIKDYVARNKTKAVSFVSMGQLLYLSTLQFVDAVVGNSSSGIIEAPSLGVATVNVGERQGGRIRVKSVIDCSPNKKDIYETISKLYSDGFPKNIREMENPYGSGNTSKKIVEKIREELAGESMIGKKFFDLDPKIEEVSV